MAQVNAGRVRFVSRGEYNNSTQYYLFDLVDYNGSSYFAKANTTGNVPTNTTYWQLVAEKGNTGGDGPVGPTGNGIASIAKTASAGLIDTYTITFTDGSTSTFNITNGQDGDVTQEYVDEHDDQLRTLFNVLPKVSDSGESVTLENTGDTMLYKMDLKGNTSQEVIQGEVGLEEEDTSIYVDDVNEDKENYITLKGNTYQETTSISGGDQYDSPSPDYPQDIQVVSGDNEVKVEGKNLVSSYAKSGNIVFLNGTRSYESYIFKAGTYTISYKNENTATTSIKDTIGTQTNLGSNKIITFTSNYDFNIWFYRSGITTDEFSEVQLERSNTKTDYEPYQSQSYPINLGSIELCKIGTYQDYFYKNNENWYLHKEIGKVVLDGTQTIESMNTSSTNTARLNYRNVAKNFYAGGLCNILKVDNNVWSNDIEGLYQEAWNDNFYFRINKSTIGTTMQEANTYLSNNNLIFYGALRTPTDTQITDTTLVSQLNALYNATIYSTTHINTETSNLLPYINLKYNVVTASPSPERASEVEVVKGNNTITISNEDGTKTQTYNLTLGNLELCKIGDYQDYIYYDKSADKWYKYGAIGKVVLNGSETGWIKNNLTFQLNNNNADITTKLASVSVGAYCTDYKFEYWASGITTNLSNYAYGWNANKLFTIRDDRYSTISDFTTALSNNNQAFYIPLSTPTTTQITDQLLVSQLDELQKAMSYYDKTLITQTNASKPFILDVVGIRDLQDIFNL